MHSTVSGLETGASTRYRARIVQRKANAIESDPAIYHQDLGRNATSARSKSQNEEQPAPPRKRQRTAVKPGKLTQKKTQSQQGRLARLIDMPIDIFAEIASYLMPIDLIVFSRLNQSLRSLLMSRSSAHIWHKAMRNVPNLPPCPPSMSEPNYLVLVFLRICSMCGKTTRLGLDAILLMRLCASCRYKSLIPLDFVPKKLISLVQITQSTTPRYRVEGKEYVLRESLVKLRATYEDITQSQDDTALEDWKQDQKAIITQRIKDGQVLAEVITAFERDEKRAKENVIGVRRSEIKRRLGELGWTEQDMTFRWSPELGNPFFQLIDQPKSLTQRIWDNLQPKLTQMLQANRTAHLEVQRVYRMFERQQRLSALFLEIKNQSTPMIELRIQLPDQLHSTLGPVTVLYFAPPFPSLKCLLGWPLIKDFHETESTISEMENRFEANREQIQDLIAKWKSSVGVHFANQTRQDPGAQDETLETSAILHNDRDPLNGVSDDTKLLLRADSLFCEPAGPSPTYRQLPLTYSTILNCENLVGSRDSFNDLLRSPDLTKYVLHPEAQEVAHMLLASMGRPNASYLDMKAVGTRFSCGRCYEVGMNWQELILHYIRHRKLYADIHEDSHLAHVGITYNSIHSPKLHRDRPMVQYLLTSAESTFSLHHRGRLEVCNLCKKMGIIQGTIALPNPEMMQHLLDVHGIVKPKNEKHYFTRNFRSIAGRDKYGFPIYCASES